MNTGRDDRVREIVVHQMPFWTFYVLQSQISFHECVSIIIFLIDLPSLGWQEENETLLVEEDVGLVLGKLVSGINSFETIISKLLIKNPLLITVNDLDKLRDL